MGCSPTARCTVGYEIALEQYILSIGVEARITLEMANTVILPAATRYQTELATNLASLKAIGAGGGTARPSTRCPASIADLRAGITALRAALAHDDGSRRGRRPCTRRIDCSRR